MLVCVSHNGGEHKPLCLCAFTAFTHTHTQATACLGTHAPAFVGETAFRTRLGALVKAVTEHQRALLARNSVRLNARCEAARTALMANATLLVKPTHKSTDEAGALIEADT